MSKLSIRLLTLAIYAMVPVLAPMIAPAKAEASSRHIKKHHNQGRLGFRDPWSARQASPVAAPPGRPGPACPGIARGFECRTWPPPMDEDPDRKASSSDGN